MMIHVQKDGHQYGPYSVDQLREYVAQGQFQTVDHAIYDGQNWVTIADVPGVSVSQEPEIYVGKDSHSYGPYQLSQVIQLVGQGNFSPQDPACWDGHNWLTVAQIPGFPTTPRESNYNLPFSEVSLDYQPVFKSLKAFVNHFTKGEKLLAIAPGNHASGKMNWKKASIIICAVLGAKITGEIVDGIGDDWLILLILLYLPYLLWAWIRSKFVDYTGLWIVTNQSIWAFGDIRITKSKGKVETISPNRKFHVGRGQVSKVRHLASFLLHRMNHFVRVDCSDTNFLVLGQGRFEKIHKVFPEDPLSNETIDFRFIVRVNQLADILKSH